MAEIIQLISITQTSHDTYDVVAVIDDIVPTHMAIYHPAHLAQPEEWGPAECHALLEIPGDDCQHPPLGAPVQHLITYLENSNLSWIPNHAF
jgi:hypothetical protein